MPRYRNHLPQLDGNLFLTDAGMETYFVFQQGIDLPAFASVVLMRSAEGRRALGDYFPHYVALARRYRTGLILDTPTWRASPDWAGATGFTHESLADANRNAVEFLTALRNESETPGAPIVINGAIGPRGDGYDPGTVMSVQEAERYHGFQVQLFAESEADLVSAITMNNVNEAIGIARAAQAARIPSVISFTVETDGRLPTGQSLGDAILETDAATGSAPAYYMINCAHPTHFADVLVGEAEWIGRLRGIRANASKCSHAELDNATELDEGNPVELGRELADLRRRFPQINVLGGCCGTDHRHIEQICVACGL